MPGQCKLCPMSLTCAGPMLPKVLTCHGHDFTWLQAVCCRHHPFLVDDGCTTEANTMTVHQMNLWEQREITVMGLCKLVGKKSGMWGFCLIIGQVKFMVNSWTAGESVVIAQNWILCALPDEAVMTVISSFFCQGRPPPKKVLLLWQKTAYRKKPCSC